MVGRFRNKVHATGFPLINFGVHQHANVLLHVEIESFHFRFEESHQFRILSDSGVHHVIHRLDLTDSE